MMMISCWTSRLPAPTLTKSAARVTALAAIGDDQEWRSMTQEQREIVRSGAKEMRTQKRTAARSMAASARPNVIIDLGFDDFMTDRQVVSLAQQLGHCHAAAKRAIDADGRPALIHCLSSYGGRVETRMQQIHGSSAWPQARHRKTWLDVAAASGYQAEPLSSADHRLVYLSAEGEETLDAIDVDDIYVIGGLVDRNQHRGLTHRRALAAGVPTARLPLEEHMQMTSDARCRALTVNHCFELLLLRRQGLCWQDAIREVLPARRRRSE